MFKYFFIVGVALVSFSIQADIDYSRCNNSLGLYGMNLDNDGKVELNPNSKIVSKKIEGNIEKYHLDLSSNMMLGGGASSIEFSIERDDQGRVKKVSTGPDKLDKKEIKRRNEEQFDYHVMFTIMQAEGNHHTFGNNMTSYREPLFFVSDKSGKKSYVNLTKLSKSQRSELGISDGLYKDLSKNWKKDKKTVKKIKKALSKLKNSTSPAHFIGQEVEFDIENGVCTPNKISSRIFHTDDNSVHLATSFSKEVCLEVEKLVIKHKNTLSRCDSAITDVHLDIQKNSDIFNKLGILPPGFGPMSTVPKNFTGGVGMNSMMGGQLSSMLGHCFAVLGGSQLNLMPVDLQNNSVPSNSVIDK